jgi:ribosome-binding factor A
MKMSPRSHKLGGSVAEKIPGIVSQLFTPDEVGFLTISAVEVSGDLMVADVFIRSIGGPADVVDRLNQAAKKISGLLAREVPTRRTILIRFKPDKSVDNIFNRSTV